MIHDSGTLLQTRKAGLSTEPTEAVIHTLPSRRRVTDARRHNKSQREAFPLTAEQPELMGIFQTFRVRHMTGVLFLSSAQCSLCGSRSRLQRWKGFVLKAGAFPATTEWSSLSSGSDGTSPPFVFP